MKSILTNTVKVTVAAVLAILCAQALKLGFTENEILLFVLGVAFGILVNLLLHKKTDYIEELKKQTDNQIKLALRRMPLKIQNHALEDYDGSCFVSLMKASSPPRTIKKN